MPRRKQYPLDYLGLVNISVILLQEPVFLGLAGPFPVSWCGIVHIIGNSIKETMLSVKLLAAMSAASQKLRGASGFNNGQKQTQ